MTAEDDPFGEVEQVFDQLTQFGSSVAGQFAVDILDDGGSLVVIAELPGRQSADISVELADGRRLTIEADTASTAEFADEDATASYVIRERSRTAVSRTLTLPERVTEEGTSAAYEDGILTVTVPKPTADTGGTDIPVQ